ncbi:SDR family NAD(P)-dependent oxidoreductase [Terribacillus halophilus]|uniref:SDR family NAD(P)-dependent oxidoreductase n=1 Tax=Terribacillus halophilus TaxID=361279 RepID=UPI0009870D20|nr:SDR family NAD(P)-dependent oxidoreductase [Terribacillus halophilus]
MKVEKTAVITGSAQGIGKAIAMHLGKDSFNIVISDFLEDKASKTAQELKDNGTETTSIPANVIKRDFLRFQQ